MTTLHLYYCRDFKERRAGFSGFYMCINDFVHDSHNGESVNGLIIESAMPGLCTYSRCTITVVFTPRSLLPFYAILVQLDTFTVLRQKALTFTLPPPYDTPPDIKLSPFPTGRKA